MDGAAAAPRPTLVRGEVVAVAGRAFVDGCDDTGGGSTFLGCTHREAGETETPLHDVALTLRQHGRTWRLGRADAGSATEGRLGHVLWKVHVPRELRPGRAVLRAKGARLVVTISAPG
ncbi:MAG: hypothetical protein ACRDO8_07170 [Nocardioidaceae bacterium]